MKIEVLLIGNELLQGKIQDKNAHWLAQKILKLGHKMSHVTIVSDEENTLKKALEIAWNRSDLVITSGGLGPTKDDISKHVIADFFQLPIEANDEALKITLSQYERYERVYDRENYHYHQLPLGFAAVYNPTGFAPGLKYTKDQKTIFCAPGVPQEFMSMLSENIQNLLGMSDKILEPFTVKTFKLPESQIFNSIMPDLWNHLEKYGPPASLPHYSGVDIGVLLEGTAEQIKKQKLELVEYFENSPIKNNIYYFGNKTLPEIILEKAILKNITFGFAESCTGGLNSSRITDLSGSSKVFMGSVVCYSNDVKIHSLGVNAKTIETFGAVSEETAREMAAGALKNLNVDIAISTTGIAGPTGGSQDKPVGTVGIGIATKNNCISEIYHFKGDREILKYRFSQMALYLLLTEINKF